MKTLKNETTVNHIRTTSLSIEGNTKIEGKIICDFEQDTFSFSLRETISSDVQIELSLSEHEWFLTELRSQKESFCRELKLKGLFKKGGVIND